MDTYKISCDEGMSGDVAVEVAVSGGRYNDIKCPHYAGCGLCDDYVDIQICTKSRLPEDQLKQIQI